MAPLEQLIVSFGLGAGPTTTIWSLTGARYWNLKDCILITTASFLGSLFSAVIFFGSFEQSASEDTGIIIIVIINFLYFIANVKLHRKADNIVLRTKNLLLK